MSYISIHRSIIEFTIENNEVINSLSEEYSGLFASSQSYFINLQTMVYYDKGHVIQKLYHSRYRNGTERINAKFYMNDCDLTSMPFAELMKSAGKYDFIWAFLDILLDINTTKYPINDWTYICEHKNTVY